MSDRRELGIYQRFFDRIGRVDSILDMPCGYGRLFDFLSGYADKVHQADISPSMLALNAQRHEDRAASYMECSALEVPQPDDAFDVVLSIRLNHHLEDQEAREAHLREIMRLSRSWCVVTYFSATSLKNRMRQLRAPIDKKRPKNTLHPKRVAEVAHAEGFGVVDAVPLSRIGSGHLLTLLQRRP